MIKPNILLIKLSPGIFLKSERVKSYFNRKLRENIKCALNRNKVKFSELIQGRGRMFLHSKELEKAQRVLRTVFGIHSTALAYEFLALDLPQIKRAVLEYCEGRLKKGTFAVRASRTGEQPFSSQEIERSVGAAVLQEFPKLKVNLSAPQTTISIEIRGEQGICYVEEMLGFGGLPQGVEGAIAVFFKGKREELACAWLLMKRGCNVFPVAKKKTKKIESNLKTLEKWNAFRKFALTLEKDLKELVKERRILMIAFCDLGVSRDHFTKYAKKDSAFTLPVLRPLLFYEKRELRNLLKTIKSLK